jgi:hypothetical protein
MAGDRSSDICVADIGKSGQVIAARAAFQVDDFNSFRADQVVDDGYDALLCEIIAMRVLYIEN